MAKIPTTRLNSAPKEYNETDFNQLIEDLAETVKVLNSTTLKIFKTIKIEKHGFL